tara:strand:+ start:213 stop:863 length:651 start_codon:yes stop_codon:yes gene_type:complete
MNKYVIYIDSYSFTMTIATACPPLAATQTDDDNPQVCIQCLAGYNQGHLHFKWFDMVTLWEDSQEKGIDFNEAFEECIRYVIDTSPAMGADEWHYPDTSRLSGKIADEYMDINDIEEYIEELMNFRDQTSGDLPDYLFQWFHENDSDGDYDSFNERFRGEFDNDEQVAEDWLDNQFSADAPELRFENCFNLQEIFDTELCWESETVDGRTYYFSDY